MGEVLGKSVLSTTCGHFREARETDFRRLLTGLSELERWAFNGEYLQEMLSGSVWDKMEASCEEI